MDQSEEDLKKKLSELERKTFDPVLGGRQEEIWARMSGVRERALILQRETEKLGRSIEGQQGGEVLSHEDQKALEKVSIMLQVYASYGRKLTIYLVAERLRQAAGPSQKVDRRHEAGVQRVGNCQSQAK